MADKDFDPEKLERMMESFEKLNEILGNSNSFLDEEEKKRRKALNDYIKARDAEIERLKKSNDARDKETVKQLEQEKILDRQNRQYEREIKRIKEQEESLTALTMAQRTELQQRRAQLQAAEQAESFKDKIAKVGANKTNAMLNGLVAAGGFVNKTFMDSTRGQSKYGESLSGLGDTVMNVTSKMGPLGKVAGLAVGGLLKLVAMGLKHNEEMNKAYENLSEFGQVDASGIPQLFENLQNAGFVMKDMDKFQGIMKESSQSLAYLGDTAAEGQKNMTQLYGKTLNTQAEKTLKNLGYTNEQALKTYVNYSSNLARLGLMQGKSQADVQKESLEYATTLDELTKLTGVQRDELQERQRRAQQDVKFRYALASASSEMQMQMNAMAMSAAGGGEEFAAGIREMIANGGEAVSDAGMKINLLTGGAATRIMRQFTRGEIDFVEANKRIAQASNGTIKSMNKLGPISAEAVGSFGITAETMDHTNLWLNKSADAERKIREDMEKQASGQNDVQRAAETQRQISERNAEKAKDKLAQLVGKGVSGAVQGMEVLVNQANKALASFVKLLTLGKVDLTGAFASSEDKIADKEKELRETKLKLGRAQRSRNQKETDKLQAQYDAIQNELSALKGEAPAAGGGGGGGGGSPATVGDEKTKKILDFIGKVESGGNYNVLHGGKTADLTNMTVQQVMQYQKGMKGRGHESTAVGKYQVIASTLAGVLKEAGVSENDKFDAATQDKIAIALMKRRGYDQYNRGTMSKGQFANNLAQEWASLPKHTGRGAYDGVGSNRALVSRADLENVISLSGGGIASGPASGYPAMLHGTEMVIPIPNQSNLAEVQKTALEKLKLPTTVSGSNANSGSNDPMLLMTTKLDTMVEIMRKSTIPTSAAQTNGDTKVIVDTLNAKLDSVIDYLRRTHNTQEELLLHARN